MAVATQDLATSVAQVIPLARIHAQGNVRRRLDNLESLAASITRHGVLTAITVTRRGDDGDFDLVAGFRRVAAAGMAGLDAIPAVVRHAADDAETLRARLAENIDRERLTDLESGAAIQQLLTLGTSVEEIATTVQTRPENVQAWADLLRLPKKVRALIDKGRMTAQEAYPLVSLLDDAASMRAALQHIDQGWEVDRAVTLVTRDRERERALAAAAEQLKAQGCPIIDAPKWNTFASNSKTQHLGTGHGKVTVPLRTHAKLPCHAAYIAPHAPSCIVYVCTDRTVHAGVEGSGVPDHKAERAVKRAEKKALRDAHAARFVAVRDAVRNRAFSTEEATNHILRLSIADGSHKDLAAAAAMLELSASSTTADPRHALLAHATADGQSLLDVALAVAIARGERSLTSDRWDWRGTDAVEHARFIRAMGVHEFSAAEEQLITERSPRRWDDADDAVKEAADAV
jgi:ParB/RepB/Spo0J family partition protein